MTAADRDPTTLAPTTTGVALDAMAERLARRLNWISSNSYRARDAVAFALTGLPPGPKRDAALTAILARLAEPPTCKLPLQVAAPSDFEPAGRAIFAALDASTIDAFHPAYERNAEVFERAARDAIALRPRASTATGDRRLREAAQAVIASAVGNLPAGYSGVSSSAINGLDAALVQAGQDAEGWRPIETAPRDGKDILVGFQGHSEWMSFVAYSLGTDTHKPGYAPPTHWFPLPAPPAQPSGDAS